jgi:hypothetical protein
MDNVRSIFGADKKKSEKEIKDEAAEDLAKVEENNKKNAERVRKEREAANKSVLRSYRIKH